MRSHNHPDFRQLVPEAVAQKLGLETGASEDSDTSTKTTKQPSKEIRIDEIRGLADFISIGSHRGGQRVVLIWPAQHMNVNAANALLKTLEEPTNGLRYILVASSSDHILPTIRSRCRLFPLVGARRAQALNWLKQKGALAPEKLLSLAGGAPIRALEFLGGEQASLREEFLAALSSPKEISVWAQALKFEPIGLAESSSLALRLLYDIAQLAAGRVGDQFPWLSKHLGWAKSANLGDLFALESVLIQVKRSADHPLNPRLVMESLLQEWQAKVVAS
jgi:DNA polymerase-3 subunit delta'